MAGALTVDSAAQPPECGDPASCSQLGGAFRSHAVALHQAAEAVVSGLARVGREPDGHPEAVAHLESELRLLGVVAERLDRAGAALQHYAQELAESGLQTRRLAADIERAGLRLDGWQVSEPWGVVPLDSAAHRREAAVELQRRADRLASGIARARAAVQRTMAEGTAALTRSRAAARQARAR